MKTSLKKEIYDFWKYTSYLQMMLIMGLLLLFTIRFGFNDKLCLWIMWRFLLLYKTLFYSELDDINKFTLDDLKKFGEVYFYIMLLLSIIVVESSIISIAFIKYYRNRQIKLGTPG